MCRFLAELHNGIRVPPKTGIGCVSFGRCTMLKSLHGNSGVIYTCSTYRLVDEDDQQRGNLTGKTT
jgi:hypothetical protein